MKRMIYFFLLFFCLSMGLCSAQGAREIVFYNWEDYTDKSLLEDFQKETGIKVILKEFKTQDEMIAQLQSQPENYDVLLSDDQTSNLLRQYRLLAKLDLSKIPNAKFIKTKFKSLKLDPRNEFSITGPLYGASGLVINTNFVPADSDSWALLWDKRYKGKIALFDDSREAMSVLLKYANFSLSSTNQKELEVTERNALLLRENDPQFADTFSNIEKVMNGELWAAQTYSGDVIYKAKSRNDIKFILPKEGFNIWVDVLSISIDSVHQDEAHKFINFLLEPKNAARTANLFFYPTTIEAENFLNAENKSNLARFFSEETLRKGEVIGDIGEAEAVYNKIFNFLKLKEK